MQLSDKLALVSGASRGIGAAIADHFLAAGATVVGTATTEAGAAAIENRFQTAGQSGAGMVLNLCEADSIDNCLSLIKDRFGRAPEILVNNAGITRDNLMMRMKDDEWDEVLLTNLTGIYRLTRRCLKPMIKARWGRIITIASVSGIMGNPGQANYSAAKAGSIGFTKSLAKEVGSRGITANVIAPGFVETDMTTHFKKEEIDALVKNIPLGRFAKPEEIAAMAVMLASDAAAYLTGETININGGLHMV